MAAQGLRETEDGVETIANPEQREAVRCRGRRVIMMALGWAAAATMLVTVLPAR